MAYYVLHPIQILELQIATVAITITIIAIFIRIAHPTQTTKKVAMLFAILSIPIVLFAESIPKQLTPTVQVIPLPLALAMKYHDYATLTVDLAQLLGIYTLLEAYKTKTRKTPST
ncbi:MAG TPA: hypothetical protein EYH26_02100 [Pyrodictium sp.]|nr:hypothetical protein [Pyrodictium sp.]HIQ10755.1 hypothetical protein [Pyrodictium sp.]HIQ55472.1 hypothetical protein [Pyrodictium sp.]